MTISPSTNNMSGEGEWQPYEPVSGSYVELLADGTFRLEGSDKLFSPADEVNEQNSVLSAQKAPGVGEPLQVTLLQGNSPLTIALRFDEGVKQWYRQDNPPQSQATALLPGHSTLTKTPVAVPSVIPVRLGWRVPISDLAGERFFKVAFFLFMGWYLFVYHGVFRGQSRDDEVLPDYVVPTVNVPAPDSEVKSQSESGKKDTILYDGGYHNKPPGWD